MNKKKIVSLCCLASSILSFSIGLSIYPEHAGLMFLSGFVLMIIAVGLAISESFF